MQKSECIALSASKKCNIRDLSVGVSRYAADATMHLQIALACPLAIYYIYYILTIYCKVMRLRGSDYMESTAIVCVCLSYRASRPWFLYLVRTNGLRRA